jgi:hypothetical protein
MVFYRYWLPELSRHEFVALRFLPQIQYEAAAPLSLSPQPDVTTRVFMLFGGIQPGDIGKWSSAQAMADLAPSIWRAVVGVDLARATDKALFRMLEWGGMEVK